MSLITGSDEGRYFGAQDVFQLASRLESGSDEEDLERSEC